MSPEQTTRMVVGALAIVIIGGFAVYLGGKWLWEMWCVATADPRPLHRELTDLINEQREQNALRQDLLDLGFTDHELQVSHMVLTDNRGHHHVQYTFSKELIAARVERAAALHRDVLRGLAGDRTAVTSHA